jgi:hypothetical protein
MNGRAAVVLPDDALFEGGDGETIRLERSPTTSSSRVTRPTPTSPGWRTPRSGTSTTSPTEVIARELVDDLTAALAEFEAVAAALEGTSADDSA